MTDNQASLRSQCASAPERGQCMDNNKRVNSDGQHSAAGFTLSHLMAVNHVRMQWLRALTGTINAQRVGAIRMKHFTHKHDSHYLQPNAPSGHLRAVAHDPTKVTNSRLSILAVMSTNRVSYAPPTAFAQNRIQEKKTIMLLLPDAEMLAYCMLYNK